MQVRIALAGNPNCGKTTLFNALTGSSQYVGNWPGVTVEKKDGILKGHKDVIIQDLPGIYSLSPYSPEEKVARNYLVTERPDVILNIIDGTNLERNLYLTTQLLETGLPMVVAVNMMDVLKKRGEAPDLNALSKWLGCPVVGISALRGDGCRDAAELALLEAKAHTVPTPRPILTGAMEEVVSYIKTLLGDRVAEETRHWYAVKFFERDEDATKGITLSDEEQAKLEERITACETAGDDDSESLVIAARYAYIEKGISSTGVKELVANKETLSDRIDKVVTNRFLALPIFFAVITFMYYISVTTVGTWATDWTNDVLFGEIINEGATNFLASIEAPDWLTGFIIDGIIGGVGTVLGFVPQIMLIFLFLAFLEDSGYMARVAFIMDRIFRKFGLSGKSFIPLLIGSGCGVPAVMAARTIEELRDRRMTIMLCTFIPCSAKTVIIAMIAGAFFPDSVLIAPSMYFLSLVVIVCAGIALKKSSFLAGEPAPFVMELPAYHWPSFKGVMIHMWERARGFIIKAGTIIFALCAIIWFFSAFNASLEMVDIEASMMAAFGNTIAPFFAPIGLGEWKGTVSAISALVAKENAVATLGVLNGIAEDAGEEALMEGLRLMFTPMAAFSFMIFNLFNPPCLVAIATTIREMGNRMWATFAITFQFVLGYSMAFVFYQLGSWLFYGEPFGIMQAVAILICAVALYYIVRPGHKEKISVVSEGAKA